MTVKRFIALFLLVATGMPLGFADVCVYKPPKVHHIAGSLLAHLVALFLM